MALDTSIYANQPNLAMGLGDVLNNYEERKNRLMQMAQQGQMQGVQLQQAQQQQSDEAKLRSAYQESGGDMTQMAQKLRSQGLHAQADQVVQAQLAQQKAGYDLAAQRHAAVANVSSDISKSPGQWNDILTNAAQSGAIHPADAQMLAQKYSAIPPEQIAQTAAKDSISSKDISDALAKQMYPSRNPELKVDDKGYFVQFDTTGKPVYPTDEKGNKIKAQPPASVQINTSNLAPDNIESNAQLIAQGKAPIISGKASLTGAGAATMKRALEINPDLTGTTYKTTQGAENSFAYGKDADSLKAFNTSLNHIGSLIPKIEALKNGDMTALNSLQSWYKEKTGSPAPTDFKTMAPLIVDEVLKTVSKSTGVEERLSAQQRLAVGNSPEQLLSTLNDYQELMLGKVATQEAAYHAGGGQKDFNSFLTPTAKSLYSTYKTKATQQPSAPVQSAPPGWVLHQDAQGHKAYVSPDGKQFQEVQ